MLAAVALSGSPPRRIALREQPEPSPAADDVLVCVEACGLNRSDLHLLDGRLGVGAGHDLIAGSEIVGTVVGHGASHRGPPVGTRVLCDSNRSCGRCPQCVSGQENRCVDCLIAGVSVAGGLAELASAPWWTLVEVPAALSAIDAAAVALSGMTAWHMLHARSHLRAGDVVLVMSASSAVGSLAVQIARDAGARVIATTSTLKVDKVRALGVDVVIDYQREPVREAVLAATAGAGADVVLDHVGGASLGLGVRCAARGGRVLTCGATQPGAVSLDPWPLFAKEISVIGCIGAMRAETAELLDAVAAGRVRPVLACTYPLTEVLDAYATLRSEDRVGKVVVTVG